MYNITNFDRLSSFSVASELRPALCRTIGLELLTSKLPFTQVMCDEIPLQGSNSIAIGIACDIQDATFPDSNATPEAISPLNGHSLHLHIALGR